MPILRRQAAAIVLAFLAAGCGSSAGPVIRPPTGSAQATTATTPAVSPTPTATGSTAQRATATPATGLKSGQKVLVQAVGFSPGEPLVVTQCAAKGTATGPGDCDLAAMQGTTADASGRVRVEVTVSKGPFGANNIVCGRDQACLISVTQATPSPSQEADTPISFG